MTQKIVDTIYIELMMTSEELIGKARERWNEIDNEGLDWKSFVNGWLEGRLDLIDVQEREKNQNR